MYYLLYLKENQLVGPFKTIEDASRYERSWYLWYMIWNADCPVAYLKCTGKLEAVPHP